MSVARRREREHDLYDLERHSGQRLSAAGRNVCAVRDSAAGRMDVDLLEEPHLVGQLLL